MMWDLVKLWDSFNFTVKEFPMIRGNFTLLFYFIFSVSDKVFFRLT